MGWVIVAIIVLLVFWIVGIYNGLVSARNGYKNAFAQIDVQLTRRHDLIPNLVETVKGDATHEKGTLEGVVEARNAAVARDGYTEYVRKLYADAGLEAIVFDFGVPLPQLDVAEDDLVERGDDVAPVGRQVSVGVAQLFRHRLERRPGHQPQRLLGRLEVVVRRFG